MDDERCFFLVDTRKIKKVVVLSKWKGSIGISGHHVIAIQYGNRVGLQQFAEFCTIVDKKILANGLVSHFELILFKLLNMKGAILRAFVFPLCFALLSFAHGQSSQKYWIHLNSQSERGLDSLAGLLKTDQIQIENTSYWLSAISANLNVGQLETVQAYDFVSTITKVNSNFQTAGAFFEPSSYGDFLDGMEPEVFYEKGLDGEGVVVGIIDAGFVDADSSALFKTFYEDGRVLGFRDFIDPGRSDLYESVTDGDFHGRRVWGFLAGNDEEKGHQEGLASGASFYLARTENGDKEHRVEEDDWIAAMEWMHSKGVRLINTSLGYSEFDDSTENYVYSDMNGRTTMISRATEKAVNEKGITFVVSAGNMGGKPWRIITAPADVRGVITVGAVEKKQWSKAGYSSVGVDFVDYVKPNISSYSNRGTSYSAPSVCGFVACLMEYKPSLTNLELQEVLEKSGHLYPFANNYIGYGMPRASVALSVIDSTFGESYDTWQYVPKPGQDRIIIDLNHDTDKNIVVFHKKDETHVLKQLVVSDKEKLGRKKDKIIRKKSKFSFQLNRPEGVKQSTVHAGDQVIEVIW